MAMQQKCHVLPENTRNARRKWLLEKMWREARLETGPASTVFLEIVE